MMIFLVMSSHYVYKTPRYISVKYAANHLFRTNMLHPFIFLSCFVFAAIFGARYNVGIDQLNYLDIYNNAFNDRYTEEVELGFAALTRFMSGLNLHYFFYFGFFAFIQIFCLFYAFRKEQFLYPYLCFILMTSFFLGWMNTIRQCSAFCIFLCCISLIEKKDFIKYAIVLLLTTFFFHKSAFLLILVYPFFIKRTNYTPSVILQVAVYLAVIYLNRTSFIQDYLDLLGQLTSMTQYGDKYADRIVDFNRSWNFGPRVLLGVFVNIVTFLISPKVKEFYKSKIFDIFYTLYFYGTCLWILFYGNFIIQRPIEYFYYMGLPVFAYTLYYLRTMALKKYKNFVLFLFYLSLQLAVFGGTIYSTTQPNEASAFYFFWQK